MSEYQRSRKLLEEFERLKKREKGEELLRLLPQGHNSGLNADLLDDMHAKEIIEAVLTRLKSKMRTGGGGGGMAIHGNEFHDPDFLTEATDEKVKVSADDTTADFLLTKLLAGTGITLTESTPGGNEKVQIAAHRAWNWADEEGFDRDYILPLTGVKAEAGVDHGQGGWKKQGLLLDVGESGGWDDYWVCDPRILKVGEEYYLYYSGYHLGTNFQIGLAVSSSPLGPFSRYGKIISKGNIPGYDSDYVKLFCPMFDPVANKFKGWYTGAGVSGGSVVYCESDDGKEWTNFERVLTYTADFFVIKLGKRYMMLRTVLSPKRFYASFSNDGKVWVAWDTVLYRGSSLDDEFGNPSLIYLSGMFYLIYHANDLASDASTLNLATSPTGLDFKKQVANPIIARGASGDYDDDNPYGISASQHLFRDEDRFFLYYTGYNSAHIRRILLATCPY